VIACRDNIMLDLIAHGVPEKVSFEIMENIRKGKKISETHLTSLSKYNIGEDYLSACNKIEYLFPKAHAVAYVLMAWRSAWFKLYYPVEYYAVYFSLVRDFLDIKVMIQGEQAVQDRLTALHNQEKMTTKEQSLMIHLEVAAEMFLRGIKVSNIDLNYSQKDNFMVQKRGHEA
jgi:DNA polymerase-3 subunit alpha (Gram-positive type)